MPKPRHSRRGRADARSQGQRRHRVLQERDARRAAARRRGAAAVLGATAALVGYVAVTSGTSALGLGEERASVRTIAVQGTARLSAEEVAVASGIERGALTARVDVESVARRLADHPWIAAARATVLPDGTVVIGVEERKPVAVAPAPDGSAVWLDRVGRPFAAAAPEERAAAALPEIVGARADELSPGVPSERLARGVALTRLAAQRGLPGPVDVALPGAARVDERAGWVLRPRGLRVEAWLGAETARFPERIGRLVRLVEEDPAGARRAAQIDLRFSGRAFLRFAEGETGGRTGPFPDGADTSGGA